MLLVSAASVNEVNIKVNDYCLNGKKMKMIDAEREIKIKDGGKQYSIRLNTATYQILKDNIVEYASKCGIMLNRSDYDLEGANVQVQYKVMIPNNKETFPVSVTCYHTSNCILIQMNGSRKCSDLDVKLGCLKS